MVLEKIGLLAALVANMALAQVHQATPATPARLPTYQADLSLLQDWSPKAQAAEPCQVPFLGRYSDSSHQLLYAAVDHVPGKESPSAKLIKKTLEQEKPDFVIVEGIPADLGESPEGLKKFAAQCAANDFADCGESIYAIYQAVASHIPFQGGEPSDALVAAALAQKGRTPADITAFYLIRVIPQWKREGRLKSDGANFGELIKDFFRGSDPAIKPMSESELRTWYLTHLKQPLDPSAITANTTGPSMVSARPTELNKISDEADAAREASIVATTTKALNNHRKVFIEYGAGHHVQEAKILKRMLPNFSCSR